MIEENQGNRASFAFVFGLLAAILLAIQFGPNNSSDINSLANQMGLEGPERSRFIQLVAIAQQQSQSTGFQQVHNPDKVKQELMTELEVFLTPQQLTIFEVHCQENQQLINMSS